MFIDKYLLNFYIELSRKLIDGNEVVDIYAQV